MCKILTVSVQIMREITLFSEKIYTAGTNFTRPPVMTVATNLNSGYFGRVLHSLFVLDLILEITWPDQKVLDQIKTSFALLPFLSFLLKEVQASKNRQMKGMVLSCLDRILELNFQSEAIILIYCFDFIDISSF